MSGISVIIPFHTASTIKKSIKSVMSQQSGHSFEIIAVDNSHSGIVFTGLPHNVRVIREKRAGSYIARNAGIRASKGDIIVFLDSDCIADSDWLENLVFKFRESNKLVVGGRIDGYRPKGLLQRYCSRNMHVQSDYAKKGVFATANIAVRRSAFDKYGLFDEKLHSGGDFEFCSRIPKQQVFYCNVAVVYHMYGNRITPFICKHFAYGWWQGIIQKRHAKKYCIQRKSYVHFIHQYGVLNTILRLLQDISFHSGLLAHSITSIVSKVKKYDFC